MPTEMVTGSFISTIGQVATGVRPQLGGCILVREQQLTADASYTFSGLTKKRYLLVMAGVPSQASGIYIQANALTTNTYVNSFVKQVGSTVTGSSPAATSAWLGNAGAVANISMIQAFLFCDGANLFCVAQGTNRYDNEEYSFTGVNTTAAQTAFSEITVLMSAGTFTGKVALYELG